MITACQPFMFAVPTKNMEMSAHCLASQQEKILLQHRQTEQLRMEKSWQGKKSQLIKKFFNEFLILSMVDLP